MTVNGDVLGGCRVLDFTHGVAGPFATMILADLGADVVKIESPKRGDVSRFMNMTDRFRRDIPRSGGDYFVTVNRGKRSVAIDLATEEGLGIAKGLARGSDVVVQSFRPGVMDRLGLGFSAISELNPAVVYGSLAAYGDRGPRAGQPGMDVGVQALSGVMSITGEEGQGPLRPGVSLADFSGGVHLAVGILGALVARGREAGPQHVEVSLLDATLAMLSNYAVAVVDGGMDLKPMGSGHPQLVPYQAFPTADGYLVIATGTNKLFRELCTALGIPDVASDPRFTTNPARVEHRDVLVPMLSDHTRQRSTDEWVTELSGRGVPVAPVNTMLEALTDPEVIDNGLIEEHDHPTFGPLHLVGSPYRFGGIRAGRGRRPPLLGEHTFEVLEDRLQIDKPTLRDLADRGVIDATSVDAVGEPTDG